MSKIEEQKSCVFGKEIKEVCPVIEAFSRKSINDYAKPVVKSPALEGLAEITEGMQEMAKQMQAAMQSEIQRLAPFCQCCPYPQIYLFNRVET